MELVISMKTVIFFVVVFALIEFVQYWQIFKLLILNPFRKSKHMLCTVNEIPKPMQAQLVTGIKELKALGFKISHFIKHQEFYASIKSAKYAAILFHPKHNCYVELENNMNPDAIRPFKVVFMQYYNNKTLMGFYAEAFSIIEEYQGFHCFDNNDVDLSNRFKNFLKDASKKGKQMNLGEKLILNKQQCTQRANMLAAGYVDFLLENQYVYIKNDSYYFKFSAAIKLALKLKKELVNIIKNEQKEKELLNNYPKHIKAPEIDAYLRHEKILNHPTFSKWIKTLLFVISALLFVLLFGSTFDFTFALLLLPVLLFHELGHLLAMKIFGYHDLQVLFMPFGAAALGKEKANTSVLKKVIIYLAGPLPGILLALGLMLVPSVFEIPWVTSLVLLLLFINYLNLLPFMPLDGGQIINHVLLGRYPIFQFVFSLISVLVFVLAAYYSEDSILGGFAIFLSLGLIGQFNNLSILRKLSKEKFKNKTQLIAKIFHQLEEKPLRFDNKQQKVKTLVPLLMQSKARFYEIILGLLLYFTAFFAPLYIVNLYTDGMVSMFYQASMSEGEFNDEKWMPDYWTKEVNKQKTAAERFSIYTQMINFTSGNFSLPFKPLLEDALKIAKENGFESSKEYPTLLKANILINIDKYLNKSEYEPLDVDENLLNELAKIENGTHIEYANTLMTMYSYGYKKNTIKNLLIAQKIFKNNEQSEQNYMVLFNLANAYELKEDYKNAETFYVQLSQLSDSYYESSELIDFYTRREQYVKALSLCEKTIDEQNNELIQMESFYQKSCAWIALLDKKYEKAENYFKQSYQTEKEKMSSLSYSSEEILDNLAFQHYQNMMVLEWSKGNKQKAKNHLLELKKLSVNNEYIDIQKSIDMLKESLNTEFSKPSQETKLILNAYEELK